MVAGAATVFVCGSEKAMLPGFRVGISSATGLNLVITSSAALAGCDASPTAKLSSSRFVIEQETVDAMQLRKPAR